ncbi:MAG: hypothetical protein ACRC3H_12215 [Lachnospiraceae bacterium]
MANSWIMTNLSGGVNNVLSPLLLPENTAQSLTDAVLDSGRICSAKNWTKAGFSEPIEVGHYGAIDRSNVKWYGVHYWSNNYATVAPFYGSSSIGGTLGVPYPEALPVLEATDSGTLSGNYRYAITYENENGFESAPGDELNWYASIDDIANKKVIVTVPPMANIDGEFIASKINLYRTANNGSTFFRLNTFEPFGGEFEDETKDLDLVFGKSLDTIGLYPPPERGKFLTESGGVFFVAVDDKVCFSEVGNPHAWNKLNFISFDDDITGIAREFQGVLIFTLNATYRVVGAGDVFSISKQKIPAQQGCVDANSISYISNTPIWLSLDGVCVWDGSSLQVISEKKYNAKKLITVKAVCKDNIYYLFHRKGVLCFDYRNGAIFYALSTRCEYAWYDDVGDEIYLQYDGECFRFQHGEKLAFFYRTPAIGTSTLKMKNFQEIRISATGMAIVTFYLDGKKKCQYQTHGNPRENIKLPYSTLGEYAEISVSMVGELKELALIYTEGK